MFTQAMDRAHSWAEEHARVVFPLCLLAIGLLALYLRTLHLGDTPSRSPDERLYTSFALEVARDGLGAYRGIFASYANDPSQWIYPSPTRITHVLLFAGVMKVTGADSAQAGAAVSWFLGIASVLVLARLGRRFIGASVGLLAALLLAIYVVELEFARRAWGESTASFLCLLVTYATLALDRAPGSWRWRAAFFAAGTLCVLSKETCIFVYALCGLWLVSRQWFVAGQRRLAVSFSLGGLASVGVAFGLLVLLAGNLNYALDGWLQVFGNGLGSNEWGALHASGPWHQFLRLLWVVAPATAGLVALGVLGLAVPSRSRVFDGAEPDARACASLALLITVGLVAACAFGPNLQYLRIMAPANPSYCLLGALGARALFGFAEDVYKGRVQVLLALALPVLLALAGTRDYAFYRDVVVRSGMQDLAVRWLLDGEARRQRVVVDSTRQALETSPPRARAAAPDDEPLARSVASCQRGDYADCVAASQAAIARNPTSPEAWNNAAAGYSGLRLWDDAIRHATRALELRGDFPLARNNLAWARDQKQRESTAALR